MLKETVILTRPTPAHQDAPFREQGLLYLVVRSRISQTNAASRDTLHAFENAAGGLFQDPVTSQRARTDTAFGKIGV